MAAAKASMLLQLPNGAQTVRLPRQRLRRRHPPVAVAMTSSSSSSSDSAKPVVLGCGGISTDYLATVASFPNPDDKIRSLALKVQGGGNVGNALTAAARLGLAPRVISKVANDAMGRSILKELQDDGVDTSYMVVSEEGNSSFTYIIVDNQTKTRTCIHTPGYPPMAAEELTKENLFAALDSAKIVYFDVRLPETALVVAEEASQRTIPILIDAERKREGLDELLNFASYVVCSAKLPQDATPQLWSRRKCGGRIVRHTFGERWRRICTWMLRRTGGMTKLRQCTFGRRRRHDSGSGELWRHMATIQTAPEAWTGASSLPVALVSMLSRLPNLKFVIVTLGERGCIMLERSLTDASETEEIDVEILVESLETKVDQSSSGPKCIASKSNLRISADGVGSISGRLLLGTAEVIPPEELIDTTGAGDAFIGAVLYGLCTGMPPEKMLPFAAQVAGCGCRGLGARSGLPNRTDPRLADY